MTKMAFEMSRIDRIVRTYAITAKDRDGAPVVLTEIEAAVLPLHRTPSMATTWIQLPVVGGEVDVTYVGPDAANQSGALLAPLRGGWLYLKDVDAGEVDAEKVEWVQSY